VHALNFTQKVISHRRRPFSRLRLRCRDLLASYIIEKLADFLGRQQHVAFFGGIDHSDRRRYRPLPFGKRNDRPELEKALAALQEAQGEAPSCRGSL
jgi:hypothetical protein